VKNRKNVFPQIQKGGKKKFKEKIFVHTISHRCNLIPQTHPERHHTFFLLVKKGEKNWETTRFIKAPNVGQNFEKKKCLFFWSN